MWRALRPCCPRTLRDWSNSELPVTYFSPAQHWLAFEAESFRRPDVSPVMRCAGQGGQERSPWKWSRWPDVVVRSHSPTRCTRWAQRMCRYFVSGASSTIDPSYVPETSYFYQLAQPYGMRQFPK